MESPICQSRNEASPSTESTSVPQGLWGAQKLKRAQKTEGGPYRVTICPSPPGTEGIPGMLDF